MGDKKPKKKSSGSNAAHNAKTAKAQSNKFMDPKADDKNKGKKK
ncbi:MAG: hypothetical protein QOJ65_2730 [Fimbriimonadaceae bacterium]|jgi:hypothetical protein|nr:hypothetical protein [Fimbriimonadaceae bacterium]